MSKKTHDLVATVATFINKETGEKKKRFQNCGFACTNEEGQISSVKIEALPQAFNGMEWEGWLNLYPLRDKEEDNAPTQQRQPQQQIQQQQQIQPQQQIQTQQPQQPQQQPSVFDEDDIPF
jgi:hypothetical protein